MDTDFPSALSALAEAGIEFIVVGGLAAVIHGAGRPKDVEVLAELQALADETRGRS